MLGTEFACLILMHILFVLIVEFSLRLVDGIGDSHGLLEILNNAGEWQGVCSDTWDDNDATVACRQLGYQQFINNSYGNML